MISFVHALTRGTDTLKENTPLDLSVFPNPVIKVVLKLKTAFV